MGKRGPQPKPESEKMVSVGMRMPAELKHHLSREVLRRKVADPSLPLSWGLSELLREIAVEHLAQVAVQVEGKGARIAGKAKRSTTTTKRREGVIGKDR